MIGPVDPGQFQLEVASELKKNPGEHFTKEIVTVEGMPFKKAIRIRTLGRPGEDSVRLMLPATRPVADCDVLFLTFYARAFSAARAEAGAGIQAQFARVYRDQAKSLAHEVWIPPTGKWIRVQLPFFSAADHDLKRDPARLIFCVGYPLQTVEIGGVELLNFGRQFDIRKLPHPQTSYAGREPNAPWRKAAADRIEKIRKGDMTIKVVDGQGRVVPGAEVSAVQTEHAFPFGIQVDAMAVQEDERYLKGYNLTREDCRKYREAVLKYFNTGTVSYCLSWPVFEWHHDPDPTNRGRVKSEYGLKTVDWLKKHGKRVWGTMLIWPQYVPKDLQNYEKVDEMKARAQKYIVDAVQSVPANEGWLVYNESAWGLNPDSFPDRFFARTGKEFMVDCFKLAHRTNPKAKYFLNDCRLTSWAGMETAKQQAVLDQLRFLVDRGAPVDGMGFQSHFVNSVVTSPERVLEIFDRFAKVVPEIWITEHDIDTMDETLRADYLRDYLTVCFSHPAVKGYINWTLWEGRSHVPNIAYFWQDWRPKPVLAVWEELTQKTWRTNAAGTTDAKGEFKTRGFLGDYTVRVTAGGKTVEKAVSLGKDGCVVAVRIE